MNHHRPALLDDGLHECVGQAFPSAVGVAPWSAADGEDYVQGTYATLGPPISPDPRSEREESERPPKVPTAERAEQPYQRCGGSAAEQGERPLDRAVRSIAAGGTARWFLWQGGKGGRPCRKRPGIEPDGMAYRVSPARTT
jgi:hypothetical protein